MALIKDKLAEAKRNSKILRGLYFLLRQPKYNMEIRAKDEEEKKRALGVEDPRFIKIKYLRNKHNGERCFIVATGPSLTLADVEKLSGEITFGMNSIIKLYDKTTWRPTYYGIQDLRVYEKLEDSILEIYKEAENIFVSEEIAKRFSAPANFIKFPYNAVYHDNYLELDKYFARFSDDSYCMVYDGYSITYSLIEIAVYMGFKEIYLLGADCSYKCGAKNHVVESGNDDKNEEKNHDKMIAGYEAAKKYADMHGIKIINCTRGGMLEVYPRMTLEEVLEEDSAR